MALTRNAGATASRTKNSRGLELLARAGLIGYGIVHLLFAWLALQIAFGKPSDDGDQSGALRTLAPEMRWRDDPAASAAGQVVASVLAFNHLPRTAARGGRSPSKKSMKT